MKKSFKLLDSKKPQARHIEAIKHEIKKYFKRERNKVLPEEVPFWDFDCKFGDSPENAQVIHPAEINKLIDAKVAENKEAFYLEILAKHGKKTESK